MEHKPRSVYNFLRNPIATLNRIVGLDKLPDRRIAKHRPGIGRRPYSAAPDDPDPIRRNSSNDSFHRAIGIYGIQETRTELYENYYEMDTDPMVSSVLDAYADEAAPRDPDMDRVVWVTANNLDIRKIVTQTLDRLNIDDWAYPVMRALARDGDVFFHLSTKRGYGVVAMRPYKPYNVARVEDNIGRLQGFAPANLEGQPERIGDASIPHYAALHYRLRGRNLDEIHGVRSSFLHGSRILWRQIQLMEDQVVLQRLMRKPDRLVWLMDMTGMTYNESWQFMDRWRKRLYRESFLNPSTGEFRSTTHPTHLGMDYMIPRGPGNQTDFRAVPGTQANDILKDLDLFLQQFASGVGFPLGFIGRGDPGSYQPGQSLSRQSSTFAKRASRLQRQFLIETTRLVMIDLAMRGLDPFAPENKFSLNMATVSPIDEIERNEIIQMQTDRLERAIYLGQTAGFRREAWIPFSLVRYGNFTAQQVSEFLPGGQVDTDAIDLTETIKKFVSKGASIDSAFVARTTPMPSVSSTEVVTLGNHNNSSIDVLKPINPLPTKMIAEGRINESDAAEAVNSYLVDVEMPDRAELQESSKKAQEYRSAQAEYRRAIVDRLIGGSHV